MNSALAQDGKNRGRDASLFMSGMGHAIAFNAILICAETIRTIYMIRKLNSGEYRLYSRKKNVKTGKRRNLGTFKTLEKAKAHERAVQYFKRH
jgi:hypothetical protein